MNDFQIYSNKYSKLSLNKNNNKKKMQNLPPSLKNIFYNSQNGLEISSQYANNQNSKNRKFDENYKYKNISYNNNNKNLSFPINITSSNKSINSKLRDASLNNLKKKNEIIYGKKTEFLNKNNSKENTFNNITNINQFKCMNGMSSKHNIKINVLPRKSNIKLFSLIDNSQSFNSNHFIGKSMSKSKSKSKSKSNSKNKNKMENKSYNSKVNNNVNKIFIDNYFKLYKNGEKKIFKKNTRNKLNNLLFKGLKKKNKSSNLLMTNYNKSKNKSSNSKNNNNAPKKESNKLKNKITKFDSNINNKKFFKEEKIIHIIINKKKRRKKKNSKNKKDKKISSKDSKNNKNRIKNIIITKAFNNSNNNNINKYIYYKNQIKENKDNIHKEDNKEAIIYDYLNNNILNRKSQNSNVKNANINNCKKNLIINTQYGTYDHLYKLLNERLKTEYNDNSLEAINKMYEDDKDEEITQKSKSLSKRNSYKFLYPEIYMKDDEYYLENDTDNDNDNNNDDRREKELDETESPLKVDTYKEDNTNSGILSFDEVKDIICYYNMNSKSKQNDFLFKINEREIYNTNSKNKYLNFFFEKNINSDNSKDKKIKNDNSNYLNNNINFKYPNNCIFINDTEYSSKMKEKYNKNLVKNV